MDNSEIELVGGPCGQHGPYTFYKAFKYSKNGSKRIISLCEFFFVKLWSDSDLVCIGELQLLWVDKNSEQMLASLRLYFLPENTPEGRLEHGEDEVLSISEKVVLRLEDLLTWITVDTEWSWGRAAIWDKDVDEPDSPRDDETPLEKALPLTDSTLDFSDVDRERKQMEEIIQPIDTESTPPADIKPVPSKPSKLSRPSVIVLSYPRYCRYRSLMKRLEGVEARWLRHSLVVALGGFATPSKNTRVLFCRDTFDYPDLEGHELLCNHLAPKLKGRPRGKRKKRSISPGGSESNESEASVCAAPATIKTRLTTAGGRNGLRCNSTTSPRRSTRSSENVEERDFINKLHAFMKSHRTPIGRVPSIGYKEIDLFAFFTKVQKLGGYENCTANRMWKPIFDELGGHHNSTSAATIMRRHYERLLLTFERHIKGEEYKPMPVSERRRLKSKTSSFSDAETSEGDRSNSGNNTPIPVAAIPSVTTPTTPSTPTEFREFSVPEKTRPEGKVSSLRSVRVKPERLRDLSLKDKLAPTPSQLTSSLPEKNSSNIPVTTAVAPVVEKTPPEKSISPLEAKETIPVMDLTDSSVVGQSRTTESDDEPIEIPYKPKTPEIIDLDAEPEPSSLVISNNSSILYDVKKRKLDILKEGGLEVTAITGYTETTTRDGRPSVIQHSVMPPQGATKSEVGNLSITVTSDSRRMPPPVPFQRSQSPKKMHFYGSRPVAGTEPQQTARLLPPFDVKVICGMFSSSPTPPVSPTGNNSSGSNNNSSGKPIVNGNTPPKVLQSRSIYTYSERIVYGNPKDPFMPPPHTPPPPRHQMRSPVRPAGGEVLDLTVKSPQKPIVEIMRIPQIPLTTSPRSAPRLETKDHPISSFLKTNSATGMPILDARVGSNLEITLVSGNGKKDNLPPPVPKVTLAGAVQRPPRKRSSSGRFVNANGRPLMQDYPQSNHNLNKNGNSGLVIPSPHHGSTTTNGRHSDNSNLQKQLSSNPFLASPGSPLFPGYISQLAAAASKGSPYLPMMDPLYYSALCSQAQGFYPPSAAANMFPPVDQIYKDLMAHSARGRFPFPLSQDGGNPMTGLTSVGQSMDNQNLMKK